MEICTNHHDDVVYESRHCPACIVEAELNAEIQELTRDLNEAKDRILELENWEERCVCRTLAGE